MWIFEIVLCLATTYQAFLSTTCVSWIIMLSISHRAILLTLTQKSSLNEMAWTGLKTNNTTTGLIRKCSASDFCFPQDCGFQGLACSQIAAGNYSQIVMCRVRILDLTTTKYQVTLLYSIFMSALFLVAQRIVHAGAMYYASELCVAVNLFLSS